MSTPAFDPEVFGQRLRHLRRSRHLTLDALGEKVGKAGSYLSLVENGHREARLSLIDALAGALEVSPAELLSGGPPTRRAGLELSLARAQADPLYQELRLPWLKPSARLPDDVIEHVVRLFEALQERSRPTGASPEEARTANAELRAEMRAKDNYFPDIEQAAADALTAVGHGGGGVVAEGVLTDLVAHFGFSLHRVQDLSASVDSVADLVHRKIYIHQRNALPTRAARSVILQTLGHFALGHADPSSFKDFLRQRVEASYFAGAVLAPEGPAVELVADARRQGDISVEDLKQVFYVSYEMAAHRLTNLATHHFGLCVHFVRADEGVIWKGYENDGVPFPSDAIGVIEGQRVCRQWGARQAFGSHDKFADHAQYTATPAGDFWCTTRVEVDRQPHEGLTIGTRARDARYFRGHETAHRSVSGCPDGECCRHPPADVASRWDGRAWPSVRVHSHVLATVPAGAFAGLDLSEVYDFLDRHSPRPPGDPRRQ